MINIDIIAKSKKWQEYENYERKIEEICQELVLLTKLKSLDKTELEISISLVSNAQIKKINAEFRDKDKPTNVLSFPALDEELIREIGLKKLIKNDPYLFLGDIIIAYETVHKESLAQKKNFTNHLTHLILHSILHLIGYDHEDDEMAEEMEKLEIKILKKLNIKNPYLI